MHFATQDNSWQELLPSNWLYIMSFALFKAGFNSILLLLWMIKCATLMQRMEVDGWDDEGFDSGSAHFSCWFLELPWSHCATVCSKFTLKFNLHWGKWDSKVYNKLVKITIKCDSQIWLVNANRLASKRYCYRILSTVTFTRGFQKKVTIHTLPHLNCIRLVSVRSSHLPFKTPLAGFRAFKSHLI